MNRYHTIWPRIAAGLIDSIFFTPTIVVGAIYSLHALGTAIGYSWSIAMLVSWSAFSIYFHARYGATPGKTLMRIRVLTSSQEERIGLRTAVIRELPWIALGIVGVFESHWAQPKMPHVAAVIGYTTTAWVWADMLTALFHPKRRALHDLIAGTVTVREGQSPSPHAGRPPSLNASPAVEIASSVSPHG